MLLTENQFKKTFAAPMRLLPLEAEPPFNFWPYFEEISPTDFAGHEFSGNVTYVYEHPSGEFQHVLVNSEDKNIFLAIILNLPARQVVGHHILNFNALYGVGEPN